MEKVTFIIPAYNAADEIERTIQSLANQTQIDAVKCLVFDDNSSDNSVEVLTGLQKKHGFIEFFENKTGKNFGPGKNRNLGIEKTTTKYLAFIDADDTIAPDWVERMMGEAEREDLDLVVSGHRRVNVAGEILREHDLSKSQLESYTGACWGRLYRTAFIQDENIRFAEAYNTGEDMMFVMGASSKAKKNKVISYLGYNYLITDDSLSKQNTAKGIGDKLQDLLLVISDVKAAIKPEDDFGAGALINVMLFNIIMYGVNTKSKAEFIECTDKIFEKISEEFPGWENRTKQMEVSWKFKLALTLLKHPLIGITAGIITKKARG